MKVEIGEILSDDDQIVLERIREYGKAWIVGGWVRDFISGKGTNLKHIIKNSMIGML